MAEMNSISHSVLNVHDLHEFGEFWKKLGIEKKSSVNFDIEDALRGRVVHDSYVLQDHIFVVGLAEKPMPAPPENQLRGLNGFRHAFIVRRDRFGEVLEKFKQNDIPFEGPVDHPEEGPLGQSIYFKDPSGNFYEFVWRRDEDTEQFAKPHYMGLG
jgi:catechol-2,3-dioxygenase